MADIILGRLATNSFNDSARRPKDWRETISYLYPNGAPLTALLSQMPSEKLSDPQFYWWTKTLPNQTATVTGVYTNTELSSAYDPAGASALAGAGGTLYVKMAEDDQKKIRVGHQVLLRDTYYKSCGPGIPALVTASVSAGASSYIACKLLAADFGVTAEGIPGTFDHAYLEFSSSNSAGIALVIGNANEEGAGAPDSIVYEPIKFTNYSQIFRTKLSQTRTAMRTKLRTGPLAAQAKKEGLEIHSLEMEKAFLFSVASEGTGSAGKPLRTTAGILFTKDSSGNFVVPRSYFSGTWAGSSGTGWTWLQSQLKEVFTYGSQSRFAYCGMDTLLQINYLAQDVGQLQIKVMDTAIGMKFSEVVTPFGTLYLKQHPLLTATAGLNKSMVIVEPDNLKYRFIDDTTFKPKINDNGVDGEDSEYLTECGLELTHPETFRFLDNFGG